MNRLDEWISIADNILVSVDVWLSEWVVFVFILFTLMNGYGKNTEIYLFGILFFFLSSQREKQRLIIHKRISIPDILNYFFKGIFF